MNVLKKTKRRDVISIGVFIAVCIVVGFSMVPLRICYLKQRFFHAGIANEQARILQNLINMNNKRAVNIIKEFASMTPLVSFDERQRIALVVDFQNGPVYNAMPSGIGPGSSCTFDQGGNLITFESITPTPFYSDGKIVIWGLKVKDKNEYYKHSITILEDGGVMFGFAPVIKGEIDDFLKNSHWPESWSREIVTRSSPFKVTKIKTYPIHTDQLR